MNLMLLNVLSNLGGYVYVKDMSYKSIYCNDMCADFCGIYDPSLFPELSDKEFITRVIVSDKSSFDDYQRIFESEHEQAAKQNKISILDVHNYKDKKIQAFYTMKSLITDGESLLGILTQAIQLPKFDVKTYLKLALNTNIYVSSLTRDNFQKFMKVPENFDLLSSQEIRVLHHTLRGQSAKQIGKLLKISNKTVESHLENLKAKLKFKSKSDLIACFYDANYYTFDD